MTSEKETDERLIEQFRGGDGSACDELLLRYKNTVLSIARRFFLVGGDTEDLVQEGMCGLYSAMIAFRGDSGFKAYACVCIKNRIADAVKRYKGISASAPFSEEDEEDGHSFSPEDVLIDSEEHREFYSAMESALSPLELKVIKMYIDGATMAEISAACALKYKQTDNALARAKNKIKKLKR